MASASLTRPAVTALSRAQSASSGPCVPRPAGRQSWEQAWSWAAAPSPCSPVLGAPSNPRAPARRPSPSAPAPPPIGTWRMPPASQATGGQASPGTSQGMPPTGPAARACPPEAHWRGGGPGPPQPSEECASSGQPCCGGSPVRRRPRGPESRGGGAQGAGGRDGAACSQAAHSGLGRRPAKRGSSWERFLKDLTGGSGVGLVPSRPQRPTPRRSTQSHNRARSWRWCPSPSGPLSSPSSKAGRERDHLLSGPTIIRSLKVHGPRCQDWLFSQSYFPGGKQLGHAVHWVAGAHCCGPRGQPWKVFRGARDQHRAAGASQRSSEAHQHLVAGLDRGTRPPG